MTQKMLSQFEGSLANSKEISFLQEEYNYMLDWNLKGGVKNSPEVINKIHDIAYSAALRLGHYDLIMQISRNYGHTPTQYELFGALKIAMKEEEKIKVGDEEIIVGNGRGRTLYDIDLGQNVVPTSNRWINSPIETTVKTPVKTSVGCLYAAVGLDKSFDASFFYESHDKALVGMIAKEIGIHIKEEFMEVGDQILKQYIIEKVLAENVLNSISVEEAFSKNREVYDRVNKVVEANRPVYIEPITKIEFKILDLTPSKFYNSGNCVYNPQDRFLSLQLPASTEGP